MANILRHGKTPLWGAYKEKTEGEGWNGVIIDSYNYSVEVKDYEQLDEVGRVKGYLIYDQTVNYDMSGTILMRTDAGCGIDKAQLGCNFTVGYHHAPTITALTGGGINGMITKPTTAITKSFSVNTSQGSAVTFSTSGSIYELTTDSN